MDPPEPRRGAAPPVTNPMAGNVPPVVPPPANQPRQGRSSAGRNLAIVGVLALLVMGVVGMLGLGLCLLIVLFVFSGGDDVAQSARGGEEIIQSAPPGDATAASEPAPALTLPAQNTEPAKEPGSGDTESAEDLLKMMRELQAVLGKVEGDGSETPVESPSVEATASGSGELSEELLALSPKEATELAMGYLTPAQRDANGRTGYLLLEKASEFGYGRAMYVLFLCYYNGIARPSDEAQAFAWLEKSAAAGDPIGMFAYAGAIQRGQYEGLGDSDAMLWLERSAQQGHPPAIQELERMRAQRLTGALAFLLSGQGQGEGGGSDAPDHACDGPAGFFEHCNCQGFSGGGGTSSDPDPYLCKTCGHKMSEHYR